MTRHLFSSTYKQNCGTFSGTTEMFAPTSLVYNTTYINASLLLMQSGMAEGTAMTPSVDATRLNGRGFMLFRLSCCFGLRIKQCADITPSSLPSHFHSVSAVCTVTARRSWQCALTVRPLGCPDENIFKAVVMVERTFKNEIQIELNQKFPVVLIYTIIFLLLMP